MTQIKEGICPDCGANHYGWALLNPRYQTCPRCGVGLEIFENGKKIASGFSPFTAERLDAKEQTQNRRIKGKGKQADK